MAAPLRLVIFDVDGTLLDSQDVIHDAMVRAFREQGLTPPEKAQTLGIIGLSLHDACARLAPLGYDRVSALAESYKQAFVARRATHGAEAEAPLYPGVRAMLERLASSDVLMGIATGKARRGLVHFLHSHGLERYFQVTQTADDAPSKPHPGMVLNCCAALGVQPCDAVMIGDTSFDMDMARNAGARGIGVAWGYHPAQRLQDCGAVQVLGHWDELETVLQRIWSS